MFLATDALADLLARNADIVRLAIFGHTHADEMRLLTPDGQHDDAVLANCSRSSAERVSRRSPRSTAIDRASRWPRSTRRPRHWPTTACIWPPTHRPGNRLVEGVQLFDHLPHASLRRGGPGTTDSGLQSDPTAKTAASQAYLRNFFPGDIRCTPVRMAAVCLLTGPRLRGSFGACACGATK